MATLPHFLAYRDTLAPKNTLANLTTALLETKAVQAFVVAASSSQTTQHSYLQAWLLCVAPNRSQLSHTLSACDSHHLCTPSDEITANMSRSLLVACLLAATNAWVAPVTTHRVSALAAKRKVRPRRGSCLSAPESHRTLQKPTATS